ncbi:MAG: hypothetical protein KJ950_10710 [Proteobacteria bacterium]|nr:hypothetical protein [Pseudomonadota bacterium]MBU1687465.1 hypothetical protein [Pseudomonadota bacterium]
MKISIDRNVVELHPENNQETADLEILWRILIDCANETKKLTPIGEYVPTKKNMARFTIEGVAGGLAAPSERTADEDSTYICMTCNKYTNVNTGESVPVCCGVPMEPVA